jgi:hypothetical protein
MTREDWLNQMVERLRPLYRDAGYQLPDRIKVSCGWPTHRAIAPTGKSRTIGQCFSTQCSAGQVNEIFVSPCISDAAQAAAVLCHELIHALDDCRNGHKGPFRRVATAIGLAGKMTATHAGPDLAECLNALCAELGPYPHATLDYEIGRKKQTTRLLKVSCPDCGYTVRTTRQWIEQGLPTCPCGAEMQADGEDGSE